MRWQVSGDKMKRTFRNEGNFLRNVRTRNNLSQYKLGSIIGSKGGQLVSNAERHLAGLSLDKCNDGAVYKDKEGMNFCEECACLIFDKYKKDEE